MYDIHSIGAEAFLGLSEQFVSDDLAQNAHSYVKTNLVEFGKFLDNNGPKNSYVHTVTYATNPAGEIIGFRYYFHGKDSSFCYLFATYVDADYRRKGVAKGLILRSFHNARENGCSEFEILLTEPTEEKDGLFKFYCHYAHSNQDSCKFTIKYWAQMKRYGYA